MKANQIFGFVFVLASCAFIFWFLDLRLGGALIRQYQTGSFPHMTGKVLSGTVIQWTGSKGGIHYHPSFSYRYQVDGQNYIGRLYRYDGHPDFYNEAEAEQIVAAHPIDSKIDVYYNPNNVRETVLSPGLDSQDLAIPFLLSSINFLIFSLLIREGTELNWVRRGKPISGVIKIITDRTLLRVRLPRYEAGPISLSVSIILMLITSMIFQNTHNNYPVEITGLSAFMGIGLIWAIIYLLLRQKAESGSQDLVIDNGAGTIELPVKYERREVMRLPYDDVAAVIVKQNLSRRRTNLFAVSLQLRDGTSQKLTVLRQERAEVVATWLKEKLGVKGEIPIAEGKC